VPSFLFPRFRYSFLPIVPCSTQSRQKGISLTNQKPHNVSMVQVSFVPKHATRTPLTVAMHGTSTCLKVHSATSALTSSSDASLPNSPSVVEPLVAMLEAPSVLMNLKSKAVDSVRSYPEA
jgi:hypothetical protein